MKPFQPKLVLFDLDGTLIEFHHEFLLTEAERIIDLLQHPRVHRSVLEDSFAEFDFFRFVEHQPLEGFIESFWKHFDWTGFPQAVPLAGTSAALTGLRERNVSTAIVTARCVPSEKLVQDLGHTPIPQLISSFFTREHEHIEWTDKTGTITRACEHHRVSPAETMLVGDIPADIESAKLVGVGCTVAVASGGIRDHILRKSQPDFVIPDIGHLLSSCFS